MRKKALTMRKRLNKSVPSGKWWGGGPIKKFGAPSSKKNFQKRGGGAEIMGASEILILIHS
jgi:hypothetical protein